MNAGASVEPTARPELDPRDLIDRTAEQELFSKLVSFSTQARILQICDAGGRGKSSLLKRLEYNCTYHITPRVPVCRLELDRLPDPAPFEFVSAVVSGLSGERFAKFNQLESARIKKDFAPFDDGPAPAVATGSAHAQTNQGINAGNYYEVKEYNEAQRQDFTQEQEQRAKSKIVEAFFDDLRAICAIDPIVVVLDAWEKCNLTLRKWIFDEFLSTHVFPSDGNLRPDKLAIVVAGRPHSPPEESYGVRHDEFRPLFSSDEELSDTVLRIASLSAWSDEHVVEFMKLNGRLEPNPDEVNIIRDRLGAGWSLDKIVVLIDALRGVS